MFGRVFRDNAKESAKVKKECKEIYRRERPKQNKRPFSKGPSFSKQDGGGFATFIKKFDYQRQSGNQGYKSRRLPGKKIQQKGSFLRQKHSSAKKSQQGRNLYQENCSCTNFRRKFTINSSNTLVKGYTPNGAKLISKYKSQQFSFSRKTAIFCKTLGKIDKQPRNFRMGVWSKSRLHFGTISGKSSTSSKNVSTGILASDEGGGIYVKEGSHPKNILMSQK